MNLEQLQEETNTIAAIYERWSSGREIRSVDKIAYYWGKELINFMNSFGENENKEKCRRKYQNSEKEAGRILREEGIFSSSYGGGAEISHCASKSINRLIKKYLLRE